MAYEVEYTVFKQQSWVCLTSNWTFKKYSLQNYPGKIIFNNSPLLFRISWHSFTWIMCNTIIKDKCLKINEYPNIVCSVLTPFLCFDIKCGCYEKWLWQHFAYEFLGFQIKFFSPKCKSSIIIKYIILNN